MLIRSQPFLFGIFYLSYKYITPRSFAVDVRDLTAGDYVLGDIADIETEHLTIDPEADGLQLDVPPSPKDATAELDMGPELEEYQTRLAQQEENARIIEILQRRPRRLERSLIRELWSCVVADKKVVDSSD